MVRRRAGPRRYLLLLASGLVGCGAGSGDQPGSGPTVIMPAGSVEDGVEVARLEDLPPLLDDDHLWIARVRQSLQTVDADGEPVLFDPRGAVPVGRDGLLVFDPEADRPLVLLSLPDGAVRARFGRRGQGPGEISDRVELAAGDGRIWVLDPANRHVQRYDTAGRLVSSAALPRDAAVLEMLRQPGRGAFFIEAVLGAELGRAPHQIGLLDGASASITALAPVPEPPPDAEPGQIVLGRPLWTTWAEGFVTMRSDVARLHVHGADGSLIREVRLPLSKRIRTEEEIRREVVARADLVRTREPGPMAITNELYPVGDSVIAMYQSGRWRAAEDPDIPSGRVVWRLLGVQGSYLGCVWMPEGFLFIGSGRGSVWGRTLDERGVPLLEELDIVRNPGGEKG